MDDLDEIICTVLADQMNEVRSALHMAKHSGMTLQEVCALADHADTPCAFADALAMYAGAMPDEGWRVM